MNVFIERLRNEMNIEIPERIESAWVSKLMSTVE